MRGRHTQALIARERYQLPAIESGNRLPPAKSLHFQNIMLVYILFTYLMMIFVIAIASTAETTTGIILLVIPATLIVWSLVRLAKLIKKPPP